MRGLASQRPHGALVVLHADDVPAGWELNLTSAYPGPPQAKYSARFSIDDVVIPVLGKWRIFERDDFSGQGAKRREELAVVLQRLEREARKFEESKARHLEREAEGLQRKPPDRHDTNTLCAATGGRVFCHIRLLTREVLTRP